MSQKTAEKWIVCYVGYYLQSCLALLEKQVCVLNGMCADDM